MNLIDISHLLDEKTPVYPGDYETQLILSKTLARDKHNAFQLHTALHTGTHIDIPIHLVEDTRLVKDFSIENFIGRGVLLDVRGEETILMKQEYSDLVQEDDIVLLYTGFDRFYHEAKYFTEHPAVSEELADFLLEKNIKMLGMDMPAPDYPPFVFHRNLLRKGVFVLENLTNLEALLPIQQFEVMAFPLKIAAEASLVRAVCREIDTK
jgi:kynurenine formamidase